MCVSGQISNSKVCFQETTSQMVQVRKAPNVMNNFITQESKRQQSDLSEKLELGDNSSTDKPTLTFWFLVLIGGFFRTACKASMRFPVQGRLRMQSSKAGEAVNLFSQISVCTDENPDLVKVLFITLFFTHMPIERGLLL